MFNFSKIAGFESIFVTLSKTNSITEIFWREFSQVTLIKISQKFLADVFAIPLLTKLQVSIYTLGCNLTENDVFRIYSVED